MIAMIRQVRRKAKNSTLLKSLKYPSYRTYMVAQTFGSVGMHMQTVVLLWLVYRLEGSAFDLSLVVMASQLSNLSFSPIGGVLSDRLPRKRIIVFTRAVMMLNALALGYLTMSGGITIWIIIVFQALNGLALSVQWPMQSGFLYDLIIDKSLLGNAIALQTVLFNIGSLIGPLLAGSIVALAGEGPAFIVIGVAYGTVSFIVALIKEPSVFKNMLGRASLGGQLREGLGFALRNIPVRTLLLLAATIALFGFSYRLFMPVFVKDVFQRNADFMGYMNMALGGGAIVGALYLGSLKNGEKLIKFIWYTALAHAVLLTVFGLSRNVYLSLLLLVGVGVFQSFTFSGSKTLIQLLIPPELVGRITSLHMSIFMIGASLGGFVMGLLADRFGAPIIVAAGGALSVLMILIQKSLQRSPDNAGETVSGLSAQFAASKIQPGLINMHKVKTSEKATQMVVTDLDGTLLNNDKNISDTDLRTLRELGGDGIVRVIATGRTLHSFFTADLKDLPIDYLIFTNGAGIVDYLTNKMIKRWSLSEQDTEFLVTSLIKDAVDFLVLEPAPDNHICKYYRNNGGNQELDRRLKIFSSFSSPLDLNAIYRESANIAVFDKTRPLMDSYEYLKRKFPQYHAIIISGDHRNRGSRVEIYPKEVSKANAIHFLAEKLVIQKDNIAAVGNDYNDIDMLDWSEHSYIVANASLKENGRYRKVASNNENGFSQAIEQWRELNNNNNKVTLK